MAQKENKIAKKRTNGKTLNPRRRAFVKKREKERGQESSLKQYKKKKGVVRGMVRREYTLKI